MQNPGFIWPIVIIAILLILGVLAWVTQHRMRSRDLRNRFGPEYDRTVSRMGDRSRAEAELLARKERVRHFNIVPLDAEDRRRFGDKWRAIQARFVEDPQMATIEADALVRDVMQARGYPVVDFDQCAADLSVDHPVVVDNYRKAHDLSKQNRAGLADTEALRQSLVHYRALFEDLLETKKPVPAEVRK